ncbi:MAG: aspartate--tRNA ligase, partial [Myxococcales bacterium]|nr:aspartate--tRNA ligase [Myxococcales bacterium]
KCFRDEDLRIDRQPEFTQIDCELSFVGEEQIFEIFEGLIAALFREVRGVELPVPFQRMPYDEAIAKYGTDKPDLRYGLEFHEISDLVLRTEFRAFKEVVERGGITKVMVVPGKADMTRRELDDLIDEATRYGAKGLAWVKLNPPTAESASGWQAPIAKFFPDEVKAEIAGRVGAKTGDLLLFSADRAAVVHDVLGRLRVSLAKRLGLADEGTFKALWVVDWPLFEYETVHGPFRSLHHPFTSPKEADLLKEPHEMRARAYDMVINGQEAGGGSIRIHNREVQSRIFKALGIAEEEARERFGFLLDALEYGAPPHGGIAFGVDRLAAMLAGTDAIRDTIAFPKTQRATCPLTDAPGRATPEQLAEL